MDWEQILDIDLAFEQLEKPAAPMPRIRTPEYHAARKRRINYLTAQIKTGRYQIPATLIAESILMGRTRWGEALIDPDGRRKDEPPI
jgi:hypothetical protein